MEKEPYNKIKITGTLKCLLILCLSKMSIILAWRQLRTKVEMNTEQLCETAKTITRLFEAYEDPDFSVLRIANQLGMLKTPTFNPETAYDIVLSEEERNSIDPEFLKLVDLAVPLAIKLTDWEIKNALPMKSIMLSEEEEDVLPLAYTLTRSLLKGFGFLIKKEIAEKDFKDMIEKIEKSCPEEYEDKGTFVFQELVRLYPEAYKTNMDTFLWAFEDFTASEENTKSE